MKKSVLISSILLVLGSFGAQAQTAPLVAPSVQPVPAPGANVLAPTAGPSASQAVSTLQQTVTQPQTTVTVPATTSPSATSSSGPVNMGNPNVENADESTLVRLMSKYQAKLAFETMVAKIEKASQDREMAKVKFELEKRKAEEEEQKRLAPSIPVASSPVGAFPGAQMPAGSPPLPAAPIQSAMDFMMQASMPSVRSIYSFDGQYFAEIMTGSTKTIAKQGTKLPNGSVVVSISSSGVVTMTKGKKTTLTVEAPATATATTSTTTPSTTTSLTGAPPIP